MDPHAAKLTINRNPGEKPNGPSKMAEAAVTAAEIRKRREQIHAQAKLDVAGHGLGPAQEDPVAAPEREDLESIEIPLRDGRIVEYGPPTNVSLSDRIARLYSGRAIAEGGPDPGLTEYRLTRLLMGVRAVDGRPVQVTNMIERTRLANLLGDQGIDLLNFFDRKHWPPLTEAELPIVKKNLRQPGL